MRVLLTGASSFTGMWFASALAAGGHEVCCTLRSSSYEGVRGRRVEHLRAVCETVEGVEFGDARFLELLRGERWDLLCHHAATVDGYRDPGFDVPGALRANTRSASAVVEAVPRVLLTGSVFEPGEGEGDPELRAFSPYGLSKRFTADTFAYCCSVAGVSFGKLVVPNPFGPLEEERYTTGLVRAWLRGEPGVCRTPGHVRDNIHVSLLAAAFADFAGRLPEGGWSGTLGPSGYRESQGDFTRRFAREIGDRLGLATPVQELAGQVSTEPAVRLNRDLIDLESLGWSERTAWNDLAEYYSTLR